MCAVIVSREGWDGSWWWSSFAVGVAVAFAVAADVAVVTVVFPAATLAVDVAVRLLCSFLVLLSYCLSSLLLLFVSFVRATSNGVAAIHQDCCCR